SLLFLLAAGTVFAQSTAQPVSSNTTYSGPSNQLVRGSTTLHVPHFIAPVVTGAPYSAERIGKNTQTLGDGTHIEHIMQHEWLYRDSAGRTRIERPVFMPMRPNGEEIPHMAEINDPGAG